MLETAPPLGNGEGEDSIDCDGSQGNQSKGRATPVCLQ